MEEFGDDLVAGRWCRPAPGGRVGTTAVGAMGADRNRRCQGSWRFLSCRRPGADQSRDVQFVGGPEVAPCPGARITPAMTVDSD